MRRVFVLALHLPLIACLTAASATAESYQTVEQHESGTRPVAIATADFDGDGLDDAVVVHEGIAADPASARVLLAAGSGGALSLDPTVYGLTIGGIPTLVKDVVTGHFDTDGNLDFAVLLDGFALGSGVWLFPGDGSGGFSTGGIFRDFALAPTSLAAGDLNGDGEGDFVIGHADPAGPGQIGVILSDGTGGYLSAFQLNSGLATSDVVIGDIDLDGFLDVAATHPDPAAGGGDTVQVFWGNGAGALPISTSMGTDPEPQSVAAGDFRGVGRRDLFVVHVKLDGSGHTGSSKLRHFEHQPGRVFTTSGSITGGQCPKDVLATDLDGDSRPDVALINGRDTGCGWSNNVGNVLLWDTAQGAFVFGSAFASGWDARQLAAGDFDGDLDTDLVVANYGTTGTPTTMNVVVDLARDVNPTGAAIRFEDILPSLGSGSGSTQLKNYVYSSVGGGAVVGDLNNDGWPDLYLVRRQGQNNTVLVHAGPGATFTPGTDPFTEVSGHGAEANHVAGTGAVIVDVNNDGWNDIYVTGSVGFSQMGGCDCEPDPANPPHPQDGYCRVIDPSLVSRMENRLYVNKGAAAGGGWTGMFTDETALAQVIDLDPVAHPSGDTEIRRGNTRAVTAADFDKDGWIDLYTGNFFMNGCGGGSNADLGMPNGLYLNGGVSAAGTIQAYADAAVAAGVVGTLTNGDPDLSWGGSALALFAADVTGDGWVDLYVANDMDLPDGSPLYSNDGLAGGGGWAGTFTERAFADGIHDKTPAGMGCDVADWNGDGLLEFAVSDGTGPQGANVGCALFEQKPALQTFPLHADPGPARGKMAIAVPAPVPNVFDVVDLPNPTGAGFGWHIGWEDFDLDGDEDLHTTSTKYVMDVLYRNDGVGADGRPILTNVGGRTFGHRTDARGAAYADFDRDGWIDVFQVNPGEKAKLFLNKSGFLPNGQPIPNPPHWLQIHPRLTVPNPSLPTATHREAIGTRIEVFADVDGDGFSERQVRVIQAGEGASGSMSEAVARFGLGVATGASVKIFWPDGTAQRLPSVTVDQRLTVIK